MASPGGRARGKHWPTKVFQQTVTIQVIDIDRYGRTVAKVWLAKRDINREMVREGHTWAYRDYLQDASPLEDEAHAREQ